MLRWLLAGAVLPALLLMLYTYRMDTAEKESTGLLVKLVALGALACVPASMLEGFFLPALERLLGSSTSVRYYALEAFVVVALSEEGCKFLMLRWATWRSPEFNYRFDGIVYAVFVSLGFAALENILYVFNYGPAVILTRGLLSIPGHMTFGVFMGLYYGQAKLAEAYGDGGRQSVYLLLALLLPCLLHGFFDFCLMYEQGSLGLVFLLFVVALDIVSLYIIKRQSRRDEPLE